MPAEKKTSTVPLGADLFGMGYDKGHDDGVKTSIIILRLAFDRHPLCIGPVEWALISGAHGETIKGLVAEFAQRCVNQGRRFEKELQTGRTSGRTPVPVPYEPSITTGGTTSAETAVPVEEVAGQ